MLKRPSSKAAASEGPEAYPLGYVEGLSDARTQLAVFFSILSSGERSRRAEDQTSGFAVLIFNGAERGSTCRVCAELQ
jgi:hypothetical protein